MKKILLITLSLLLVFAMIPGMAFADVNTDAETLFPVEFLGYVDNTFTLKNSDLKFDPYTQFHSDNSDFDLDLAISSLVIAMESLYQNREERLLSKLGFDTINFFDYDRTGKEEYMTGYTVATREILRDGDPCKPCNLLLISISASSLDEGTDSTSGWSSALADLDFLNHEWDKKNSTKTDFYSDQVLTFTEAAKLVLNGSSDVVLEGPSVLNRIETYQKNGQDYLIWVVGQSRGGAIGNYLSKLLIDEYGCGKDEKDGKDHVVSYLFSVPNVDRDANSVNDTEKYKYNTIFNIVNPDDAVTYVPFGKEGGKGWGYSRWGVDIPLKCIATASPELREEQAELFRTFTKTATKARKEKIIYADTDGNYYGYNEKEGNGVAVTKLVKSLARAIPDPYAYYNDTVTYSSLCCCGINLPSYVMQVKSGEENPISLFLKLEAASTQCCDLHYTVNFAMQHLLGYHDLNAAIWEGILPKLDDIESIRFVAKEAYIAHTPENYLSWLIAEKNIENKHSTEQQQIKEK